MTDPDELGELGNRELLRRLEEQPRPPREARMEVYEEIARRYRPGVLKLLAWLLRDADAAQDVGQDVFLDVFRFLEERVTIRDPDGLGQWLNTFARNRAKKYWSQMQGPERQATRDEMARASWGREPGVLPGDDPIRLAEVRRLLAEVRATLPEDERQVARLRYEEHLTAAQIAPRLDRARPAKTVSNICTKLDATLPQRFHVLLLIRGDRTSCIELRTLLERHERLHGKTFTAELATKVIVHYSTCTTCSKTTKAPQCRHGLEAVRCRLCLVCPHGSNCRVCPEEMKKLIRDAAPALIPVVFAAAFHERVSQAIATATAPTPAGTGSGPPASGLPATAAAIGGAGTGAASEVADSTGLLVNMSPSAAAAALGGRAGRRGRRVLPNSRTGVALFMAAVAAVTAAAVTTTVILANPSTRGTAATATTPSTAVASTAGGPSGSNSSCGPAGTSPYGSLVLNVDGNVTCAKAFQILSDFRHVIWGKNGFATVDGWDCREDDAAYTLLGKGEYELCQSYDANNTVFETDLAIPPTATAVPYSP
jgi:RNA polymerase sigma factor (sigma-70 family)